MSQIEQKVRRAAYTYVCHVKSHELQVHFEELWKAIRPSEPAPHVPNWPADSSRNLLMGMRIEDEFIDALCTKYEIV